MKIVYTAAEGGTCIVHPAPQAHVVRVLPHIAGLTEQEYVEWIRDRDVPADATNVSIVPDDAIPQDRTFRDALKHDLTFDKPKCVELTKERLRRERAPLLAAQDVEYLRALEQGKPTAAIVAEKQRLRDVTALAHEGLTLEELKALKVE